LIPFQDLAAGKKDRQVPFTRIAENRSQLIAAKYLPRGLALKDPRAMKREDIIKFLTNIVSRQDSHGVKDAFRFKQYLSTRKKGVFYPAKYPDPVLDPTEIPEPEPTSQPATAEPAPSGLGADQEPSNFQHSFQTYPLFPYTTQDPPAPDLIHQPVLTLDPNHRWDRPGSLDPSLDPSYERPVVDGSDLFQPFITPFITPAQTSTSFLTPIPAQTEQQITPRRKGRNADKLAIQEAASLLSNGPRRSGRKQDLSGKRTRRQNT
jgi:hypothetical protein